MHILKRAAMCLGCKVDCLDRLWKFGIFCSVSMSDGNGDDDEWSMSAGDNTKDYMSMKFP